MNPIFSLIVKQLPRLLPIVESMLKKPAPVPSDNGRLAAVEQSVGLLAERSDYLERKLKRLTIFVIVGLLASFLALIMALVR